MKAAVQDEAVERSPPRGFQPHARLLQPLQLQAAGVMYQAREGQRRAVGGQPRQVAADVIVQRQLAFLRQGRTENAVNCFETEATWRPNPGRWRPQVPGWPCHGRAGGRPRRRATRRRRNRSACPLQDASTVSTRVCRAACGAGPARPAHRLQSRPSRQGPRTSTRIGRCASPPAGDRPGHPVTADGPAAQVEGRVHGRAWTAGPHPPSRTGTTAFRCGWRSPSRTTWYCRRRPGRA